MRLYEVGTFSGTVVEECCDDVKMSRLCCKKKRSGETHRLSSAHHTLDGDIFVSVGDPIHMCAILVVEVRDVVVLRVVGKGERRCVYL